MDFIEARQERGTVAAQRLVYSIDKNIVDLGCCLHDFSHAQERLVGGDDQRDWDVLN